MANILIERKRRRRRKEEQERLVMMTSGCDELSLAKRMAQLKSTAAAAAQETKTLLSSAVATALVFKSACQQQQRYNSNQYSTTKMVIRKPQGVGDQDVVVGRDKLATGCCPARRFRCKQHCKVRLGAIKTNHFSQTQCFSSMMLLLLSAFLLISTAFTAFSSTNMNLIPSHLFVSAATAANSASVNGGSGASNLLTSQQQSISRDNSVIMAATPTSNAKARYKTMYACEDKQLIMDCDFGSKINLIRANYGRFSITQCNEQGQLDLSTDCMSPITFRIMKERCQDKQKCSVNATSSIFGDKCPKTRKYLEVHFQCQPDPRVLTSNAANSAFLEPPDRIDLRNSSSILQQQQQQQQPQQQSSGGQIVYPQMQTTSSNGVSSILPPNNPPINGQHLQQPSTHQNRLQPTSIILDDQQAHQAVQQQNNLRPPQQQQQQPMTVMNSEILSYNSIGDLKAIYSSNQNLSNVSSGEPIIVTLRHTHTENMSNPRCVLWDQMANQWTERGSQIMDSNSTHTVCAFDQASSYMLVSDYLPPYPTISQINPMLIQNQPQPANPTINIQPTVPRFGDPLPGMLDLQPSVLDPQANQAMKFSNQFNNQQQQQQQGSSPIVKFFSLFGYLLAFVFVVVALMTIAFIASSMRSSAGAALKSLGNFTAFSSSGPKYKGRRSDGSGSLHNKDLLVINNQNGHQFLYAPASSTKISSSASTHILASSLPGQHQGTLHQIQQQQQMFSAANGTLSNLSGTGAQSNNYYYGLMGLTPLFQQQQQQQSQLQHHLSQHHLNQHNQIQAASYHHQANKSTISTESANSTPSSSGVESGSASMHQQQQAQQQQSCLVMSNNDYNLMSQMSNYGQAHQNLMTQQPQPTLTLNAHYSSSGPVPVQQRMQLANNGNSSMREHIYECVDDDKPYTARLLLPMSLNQSEQFNTMGPQQHQQQLARGGAMTLSSRMLQMQQQQQQQQLQANQTNKRLFSHTAIVRDNQNTKTNIICSKLAQVTPQRATEINNSSNKFHHDVMAIYNGSANDKASSGAAAGSSSGNATCYGGLGAKLSTDC